MVLTDTDKEQVKTWIEALRSGKYKQSKGMLQSPEGFCCLGVACKVLIADDKLNKNTEDRLVGVIPDAQVWSPLWLRNVSITLKSDVSLVELNDAYDWTFNQIADLVEDVLVKGVTVTLVMQGDKVVRADANTNK